ncbi:putative btb poz domain protein [Botrytis fragariae]|uniref:Putative btb poz domain protein n=1 Tax=Botrytis fragariae TaxID=1964551 RepID=A0A8H6EGC7_9HELO|nr:putative btb poz domain protein [Botrytis fragariae]KAF5870915.1 putative btb poz domain protein [Botrytis fragariae]
MNFGLRSCACRKTYRENFKSPNYESDSSLQFRTMTNKVDRLGELILKEGDKYSDLIIIFQGVAFRVHRNIICVQSEFFTTMVDSDWEDGTACEILLESDETDLDVFQRMVRFFYHRSLDDEHDLVTLTKLYVMGGKWNIPFLKENAASKVEVLLDTYSRHGYSSTDAVFEMLKLAYACLPQLDTDLKVVILHHVLKHESLEALMNDRDFRAFVVRNVTIAIDLLEAQLYTHRKALYIEKRSEDQ